jgi:two-component system sensor histidine kinase UhpB
MKRRTSVVGDRHLAGAPLPSSKLWTEAVEMRPLTSYGLPSENGSAHPPTMVGDYDPGGFTEEPEPISADNLTQSIEADVKRFVARELHDQVVQTLTTALLDMERFKSQQFGRSGVQTELALLQDAIRGALNQIRTLLYDLRDQPFADTDFVESVRNSLITVFEARTGIQVTLSVSPSWPDALSPRAAMNLHRAIQEALNNVMLHAGAGVVHIKLDVSSEGEALVTIEDDGRGLEDRRYERSPQGLLGMTERAVLLGGRLSINSEPGRGTTVRLMVPAAGLS